MAERAIKVRTYIAICVLLVLLTLLTVSISFFHLPSNWHLALGLSIGGCWSVVGQPPPFATHRSNSRRRKMLSHRG